MRPTFPTVTMSTMTTYASPTPQATSGPEAAIGLALVRVTIGAMFVWVFFENRGKGLYKPAGYAGLIGYYIKASHCPDAWRAVMRVMADHAAIAAPLQGLTEISLGILTRHRTACPACRICGFSVSRRPLDLRVRYLVDLGTARFGDRMPWALYRPRRPEMGRRRIAGTALASFCVVVIGPSPRASIRHHTHPQ